MSKKKYDLRITYICAHCGQFATISFWALEVLDAGTMFVCEICNQETVIDLFTPEDRRAIYVNEPPFIKPVPPDGMG